MKMQISMRNTDTTKHNILHIYIPTSLGKDTPLTVLPSEVQQAVVYVCDMQT